MEGAVGRGLAEDLAGLRRGQRPGVAERFEQRPAHRMRQRPDGLRIRQVEHQFSKHFFPGAWVLGTLGARFAALPRLARRGGMVTAVGAGQLNPLPAAIRIADDCGHGHDPASRYVHRGRQAV
jgi:hypothetical protein